MESVVVASQGVVAQPVGSRGVLIAGSDTVRGISRLDQASGISGWCLLTDQSGLFTRLHDSSLATSAHAVQGGAMQTRIHPPHVTRTKNPWFMLRALSQP
jgi:hypothetical protein